MNSTSPTAALYSPHPSNGVPNAGPSFNYHPHHTPLRSYRFSPYSIPPIYIDKKTQLPPILDLQATVDGSDKHISLAAAENGAGSSGSSRSPSSSSCGAIGASPAGTISSTYSPVTDRSNSEVLVVLTEKDLWQSFYAAGNEMIVTKPGRRLFPTILVTVTGLIPSVQYTIKVRFVSADKYRYKHITGHWTAVGESDIIHDESKMVFVHPSSPCYGEMWIKKPISFKSIKITHYTESQHGNILLHTMHKYRIEVVITPLDEQIPEMVFPLNNTEFIAITSYQSGDITRLKVNNNPFAKGFRDREAFPNSTTYHANNGSYTSFLTPPYTPFIHPLWKGSVFPSMSNLPPAMFPSSTNTPALIQSPTSSIPSPMVPNIANNMPTQPMFQPYLPPVTSVPPVFPSMTNILSPTCSMPQIYQSATSIPQYAPVHTPLIHPPSATSVPLAPLSPPARSPSPSSSTSSTTCSAVDEEETY